MEKDYAAATNALSGKPSGKLKVSEIHVRKGHKGGYIAKHHMEDVHGNRHHKTPEYPLVSMSDLHKHMQEHMGEESAEVAQGEEGEQGES